MNREVFDIFLLLLCLNIACADAQQQNHCYDGEFQCDNGQCISATLKCDLSKDCQDGSDETFVQCHDLNCTERRCAYGACFKRSKMCDGILDCWDGTDEHWLDCTPLEDSAYTILRGNCLNEEQEQFECKESKECLPQSQLCDSVAQCRDKSDERKDFCFGTPCPAGSFSCNYGACIPKSALCDHIIDCHDGSDELDAICKKRHNILSNQEWSKEPRQLGAMPMTTTTTTPHNNQNTGKRCNVTGTALRLRTMYNGLPYMGDGTVSHQTTVRLCCAQNHFLMGDDVNTCDNGQWKAPWSECLRVCRRHTIINDPSIRASCSNDNNIIDCVSDPLVVGSRAIVQCAPGYKSSGTIAQRVEHGYETSNIASIELDKL
ncbi:GH19273 [Drosophila grimshawi]|uniref:GH19273 n=1 Tax=Drosophila grimshawi TaxID=7222 RepID=B4JF89_DROGR|nr:GH19273 [Drosophila grimshawi]